MNEKLMLAVSVCPDLYQTQIVPKRSPTVGADQLDSECWLWSSPYILSKGHPGIVFQVDADVWTMYRYIHETNFTQLGYCNCMLAFYMQRVKSPLNYDIIMVINELWSLNHVTKLFISPYTDTWVWTDMDDHYNFTGTQRYTTVRL